MKTSHQVTPDFGIFSTSLLPGFLSLAKLISVSMMFSLSIDKITAPSRVSETGFYRRSGALKANSFQNKIRFTPRESRETLLLKLIRNVFVAFAESPCFRQVDLSYMGDKCPEGIIPTYSISSWSSCLSDCFSSSTCSRNGIVGFSDFSSPYLCATDFTKLNCTPGGSIRTLQV